MSLARTVRTIVQCAIVSLASPSLSLSLLTPLSFSYSNSVTTAHLVTNIYLSLWLAGSKPLSLTKASTFAHATPLGRARVLATLLNQGLLYHTLMRHSTREISTSTSAYK